MEIKRLLKFILFCSLSLLGLNCTVHPLKSASPGAVNKIEMRLSAFGVEADGFPTISAIVDLKNDTSYCDLSYYDPKFPARVYRLTKGDMVNIRYLISQYDIRKLKKEYTVSKTDQPASTVIFYLTDELIKVSDYGLEGQFPLKELYKLVYKLDVNFR